MYILDDYRIVSDSREWKAQDLVFIKAPPGSGKTTAVDELIIKPCCCFGKKVLCILSRVALRNQRIRDLYGWCNLEIRLYQELENLSTSTLKEYLRQFDYVVCDEAAYFLKDSLFNTKTIKSLSVILSQSPRYTLIFISANIERIEFFVRCNVQKFILGEMRGVTSIPNYTSCYDYYYEDSMVKNERAFYCDSYEEFADYVVEDEKKTLVFVPNKSEGGKLRMMLKKRGVDVVFLTSDSKFNSGLEEREFVIFNEIVKFGYFTCKVVITTSVLDVGVSLHDSWLQNIALFAGDYEQMMQMKGRKRIHPGESVNYFFLRRKANYYNGILRQAILPSIVAIDRLANVYCENRLKVLWQNSNCYEGVHKGCYWDDYVRGNLVFNPLSYDELMFQRSYLEGAIDYIKNNGEIKWLSFQAKMIGYRGPSIQKLETSKQRACKEVLYLQFEEISDDWMTLDEFHNIVNPMREQMKGVYSMNNKIKSTDNISVNLINNFFEQVEFPFEVISKVDKKTRRKKYKIRKKETN